MKALSAETLELCDQKALAWIRSNTILEQGIITTSRHPVPYPEVTGYLIPTLLDRGNRILAERYADYLSYLQRPSGAYAGSDGQEYIFDTAQVLRGLLRACQIWPEYEQVARNAADYLARSIDASGRMSATYGDAITEYVHVYALPPLLEAGRILHHPQYTRKAKLAIRYYKSQSDVLDQNRLTHFLAYIIDGFIECGEREFVRKAVRQAFSRQTKNGAIPAYPNVSWVCSTGLAQFAIIALKMNMTDQAARALHYLCNAQNKTGGFYGSYGRRAQYFPREEISWANKFFLDAVYLYQKKQKKQTEKKPHALQPLNDEEWNAVMLAEADMDIIIGRIQGNQFPVWIKPLLTHSVPGDSLVELGSGTGEMSAILAEYGRQVHLFDYSADTIAFNKQLFERLELQGHYYVADILKKFPLADNSVDWVWNSGTLEHFSDEQLAHIMKESLRVARKGVMSLVPNANALFYRIGKYNLEQDGTWLYGEEKPKFTFRPLFEQSGLKNIEEYSVGTYHNVHFTDAENQAARRFFDSLPLPEMRQMNQGYLLFTYGEK